MHVGLSLHTATLSGQALGTQTAAKMDSEDSVPFVFLLITQVAIQTVSSLIRSVRPLNQCQTQLFH